MKPLIMRVICFAIIAPAILLTRVSAQGQCTSAKALTIGANDNTCNSQSISGPTKLKNNTPPISTISGSACGLTTDTYSNWFSFTGDGTTIRVKVSGQNKVVGMTVFENQTCGTTMTAKSCVTLTDDGIPHVIDVPTTNGASYLIAIVGSSSSLSGKVCAYKTNGSPYNPLCDPIMYPVPVSLPVKTKDLDCFSSNNNVKTDDALDAPTTPCSTKGKWWWGEFTATDTKTDLYLWGKDETSASIEVLEDFCGTGPQKEVFCNNNTGAKDEPNWGTMTTVPGKKYRVVVKSSSSMNYGNLCISSQPPEAQKPTCTSDMSFEGGTSAGWQTKWGSYHLASAPGTVFTWDLYNSTAPGSLYQVTTGAGRDPRVSFLPIVAPGGGVHSFRIGSIATAEGAPGTVNGKSGPHAAATEASYCFTVSAANAGFGYKYAVVMDYVTHPFELQPLFDVIMTVQATGDTITCGKFQHVPNDGVSPFQFVGDNTDVSGKNHGPIFTPWTDVITDLSGYAGQTVCVTFRVKDCEGGNNVGGPLPAPYDSTSNGSHWAYAYIDTYCIPMVINVPEYCTGTSSIQICAPAGYKTYSWPTGQPGAVAPFNQQCLTINNPSMYSGTTYTVNMTSITNCPTKAQVKINSIPIVKTPDTTLCTPVSPITLTVSVSDPTKDPPYTYAWSNGLGSNPSATANPTATTTYTVTVTNKSGCATTETIKVTVNTCGPSVVATGKKICPGACASITATGSGGATPYSYTWTGGLTGATQNFCPASTTTYTVTISDANNVTATDTVIVTINPSMTLTTTPVNAKCKGSNDGSASVAVTGGTAAFTYIWAASGGTAATTTSTLSPGIYTVTVTDSKGCTKSSTVTITEPPPVTAVATATNPNCPGGGSVDVTPNGGTPIYSYSWMPGNLTTKTASGLASGTYTVTVTDANGCTTSSSATVIVPPPLVLVATPVDGTCGNSNGSASVNVTGGTPGYTYSWSPSGGTSSTALNLPANTFTVLVTDSKGCTATSSAIVANTPPLTVAASLIKNVSCNGGNDGAVLATPTGGTVAINYSWTPIGGTGQTASSLIAGIYTVNAVDSKGCTASSTVTVTEPPPVTASTSITPANCGTNTGTATATGGGGTGSSYTYSWLPGGGTTSTINNLAAGTYVVTVTDANGCSITSSAIVTSTGGVTATIQSHVDATCVTLGSAVVTTAGGTNPFTYSWSPSGGTNATATALPADTYTVQVTDANGCISSTTVIIAIPAGPQATTTKVDDNCGKGQGSATVNVTGGTSPYTLSWSLGAAGNTTINNLLSGTYTVQVTDANGCTTTTTAVVDNLNGPTATATSTNIKCFGDANGTAQVSATGGAMPYSYSWNDPSASTNTTVSALIPGIYSVTVSDAVGCTSVSSVTITEPAQITINATVTNANCATSNGSISVTASGGTGTLTPTWSSSGSTGFTVNNLAAGSYTVSITDASGCTTTSGVIVSNIGSPSIVTGPIVNVLCKGGNNGSATINITGGSTPYNIVWTPASVGTGTTISSLTAGAYTVAVTDALGCIAGTIISITEPPLLTAATKSTNPNCPGGGKVDVTPIGGTPTYTFSWMPGNVTTQTDTGLVGGIYTVTVTDANGCTTSSSATVVVPPPLVLVATPVDGTCGNSNGSASVNVTGGTSGYTYSWSPSGGNGLTALNLPANTFTVFVTDSKGCKDSATAVVGNSPPLAVTASLINNVSCNGGNDGSVLASPGGGTGTIGFTWTPVGGTGSTASSLIAGTYTVNVIDTKGCTAVSTVTVTEPPLLAVTAPAVPMICVGQSTTLTATASGGTPNYTYLWNPGALSGSPATDSPSTPTTYTVAVVDTKGCTTSATVFVDIRPPLQIDAGSAQNVCSGSSVTLTANASGGDGNYTYTWQPGNTIGTSITVTPTGTQIYTVTVSDGCGTTPVSDTVTAKAVLPLLTPAFTPDSAFGCAPLCVSFNNVTTGGVTQSCSWDFGDGGTTTNCSPTYCYRKPGNYTVKLTVLDANNCSSSATKSSAIRVYPIPVAGFVADPKSVSVLEPTINFYDASSKDVVLWNWNFGDVPNSGSTKQNPTYSYKDTGQYKVQLVVTTAYGCKDTITEEVFVHGETSIYVPDAFTPNGDGINDKFFPKGFMLYEPCFKMLIFDRWGNMIFSTTDMNMGWDGKANGGSEVAQQDVYVWKIEACDYQKTKLRFIGHVTLVK